jgi:hypothetical protein
MAHLNKARTIFAFTSPRTIEKIIPEIQILVDGFSGQPWNTTTQVAFFEELFASDFYEGKERPLDIAFAGRDRITRAPKALGFVDLKPVIKLTAAGEQLLSGKRTNEVIARQLLKFQLPSPYHTVPADRVFNIRPYLELLRMVKEIGNISKTEIAIFFVKLIDYKNFNKIRDEIKAYRAAYKAYTGNKKGFTDAVFDQELSKVYADEIEKEQFKGRQDDDTTKQQLLDRKKSNQTDYADALIRYLRATQLISFDRNFRVIVSPARSAEVDYILSTVSREALAFKNEKEFKQYLFDPFNVELFSDKKANVETRLESIGVKYDKAASVEKLKDLLDEGEVKKLAETIKKTEQGLKNYKEFDDIIGIFDKIHQKEIPDPSLYLEWNVWRAMVMINYAKRVQGNFRLDLDGLPLTTAGAKLPDIEIDYEGFKVIVEVTMSSGQKQYDMEGEPVPRHFGVVNKSTTEPVYCIFIAPKISEGTLSHYFALNTRAPKYYWKSDTATERRTNIIPMSVEHFRDFITTAKDRGFNDPKNLKSYLDSVLAESRKLEDEEVWLGSIQKSVTTWV